MSDGSNSGDAQARPGRVARFKGILKRRGRFPIMLLVIAMLAIAFVYQLVTALLM